MRLIAIKCKNLDYRGRTCQRRPSLALTTHDCHSEAAGRRISFPKRSFAEFILSEAEGLRMTRTERNQCSSACAYSSTFAWTPWAAA